MTENKFIEGVRVFKPKPNAPEFIKFSGIIKKSEILAFLKDKDEEIRFDCKESRNGAYYLSLDSWKPTGVKAHTNTPKAVVVEEDDDSSLPF